MNGGKLNKKVSFFDYTELPDGAGGFTSSAILVLSTWADVKSVKSAKTLEALQDGLNSVYQVTIRMRKGFEPKSHYDVEYKGTRFAILTIESDEIDLKEWVLTVTERED